MEREDAFISESYIVSVHCVRCASLDRFPLLSNKIVLQLPLFLKTEYAWILTARISFVYFKIPSVTVT